MWDTEIEEARDFWNGVAEDWRIQVGDEGDTNRRLKLVLYHLAETEKQLRNCKTRPHSVAFKLQKKPKHTTEDVEVEWSGSP
jgi:hypothetical protein